VQVVLLRQGCLRVLAQDVPEVLVARVMQKGFSGSLQFGPEA
jgi:hypothetical protein